MNSQNSEKPEEFLLKWHDHHNSFFSMMQDLYVNEILTDVTLACGGELFESHKLMLCASSTFFRKMFTGPQSNNPFVYLEDVNPRHLELLLEYIYTGEVNVLIVDLGPLMETARCLQIECLEFSLPDQNKLANQNHPRKVSPPPLKKTWAAKPQSMPALNKFDDVLMADPLVTSQDAKCLTQPLRPQAEAKVQPEPLEIGADDWWSRYHTNSKDYKALLDSKEYSDTDNQGEDKQFSPFKIPIESKGASPGKMLYSTKGASPLATSQCANDQTQSPRSPAAKFQPEPLEIGADDWWSSYQANSKDYKALLDSKENSDTDNQGEDKQFSPFKIPIEGKVASPSKMLYSTKGASPLATSQCGNVLTQSPRSPAAKFQPEPLQLKADNWWSRDQSQDLDTLLDSLKYPDTDNKGEDEQSSHDQVTCFSPQIRIKGRRHKCHQCGKLFVTPYKLQRHRVIHTGTRPYVCHLCVKGFTQKEHLKYHLKLSHPPFPNLKEPTNMELNFTS